MDISIIIPSYNQQEYLPDAIESALNQTKEAHDIVIIDDGSTDNSLEIAKKYSNLRVYVISQVNKGLASARNTGIMFLSQMINCDYILPLDADDILMDNALERIDEVARETNADVIAPSLKCFGVGNETVILMPNPKLEDFRQGNRIGYCTAIKRDALLEVGGYSPRMVFGYEDLHLSINLLIRGKTIVTIPEVLWLYRTKPDSMWVRSKEHHQELLAQINKDFPYAMLSF